MTIRNILCLALTLCAFNTIMAEHRVSGEILPDLSKNNLVKNSYFEHGMKFWRLINPDKNVVVNQIKIKNAAALKITKKDDKGFAALISSPCKVKPGKKYFLTALYNCRQSEFGTFSKIQVVPYKQLNSFIKNLDNSTPYVAMGKCEILSRKTGEWVRRSAQYKAPAGVDKVCIVIVQYGVKSEITYSSIYFGSFPSKRPFDKVKYYSDYEPSVKEPELSKIYSSRKPATASVVKYGDVPAFNLNGEITAPLIYFGDAFLPKRSKLKAFSNSGINLQIISLNRNRNYWKADGEYDFAKVDKYLSEAICRNPYGNYIIRIDVSPFADWDKQYPEHVAVHINGKPATGRHGRKAPPSYWSDLYREKANEYVRAIVSYLKTRPYYSCIAGFFLSGNEDGQFYYNSLGKTLHNGQSPSAVRAFRMWLKKRYKTIKALREAWHQPEAEFDKITVPVKAERIGSTFLNPADQRNYIDFIKFLNESMAEFANQLCRTAKDTAGKEVITVMWWGRGGAQLVYPHFGQSKIVFPNSDMNVMGSQAGYYGERENAGTCFMPYIFDSARIHNKITMLEADFRTWCSPLKNMQHDYHVARYWNMYDFKGALLRDFGKQIAVGGGLWFFDMSAGWFNDPEIMKFVKEVADGAAKLYKKQIKVTPAQIALVVDEQNFYRTTEQLDVWNGPNYHSLRLGQRSFLRSGLKYDLLYFNDIIDKNMDDYKVYIFMNSWFLSEKQKNFISKKLKRNGKTLVWIYAPGYLTSDGFSLKNMETLTGIKISKDDNIIAQSKYNVNHNILLNGVKGKICGLGIPTRGPRFTVTDKNVFSLAKYNKDGATSTALKRMPGWNSIYISAPAAFSPQFLQNIARFADAHVYNTPGDMFVYHRDDLVCLHGVEGKTNHLQFPKKVKITDLFSGKTLLDAGKKLQITLNPGETRLLHITKQQ